MFQILERFDNFSGSEIFRCVPQAKRESVKVLTVASEKIARLTRNVDGAERSEREDWRVSRQFEVGQSEQKIGEARRKCVPGYPSVVNLRGADCLL